MDELEFLKTVLKENHLNKNILFYGDFPDDFYRDVIDDDFFFNSHINLELPFTQGTNYVYQRNRRYYNFKGIKNCHINGDSINCIHNRNALITFLSNDWEAEGYHTFDDGRISFSTNADRMQYATRNTYLLLPTQTNDYQDISSENELVIDPSKLFPNGFLLVISPSRGQLDEFITTTELNPKKTHEFGRKVLSGIKKFHISSHNVEQLEMFLKQLPECGSLNRFLIVRDSLSKFDKTIIDIAKRKDVRIIAFQSLSRKTKEDRDFFKRGKFPFHEFGILVRDGAYCEYLRQKDINFQNPIPTIEVIEDTSEPAISRDKLLKKIHAFYKANPNDDALRNFFWSILRTPIYFTKIDFLKCVMESFRLLIKYNTSELESDFLEWFKKQQDSLNDTFSTSQKLLDSIDEQGRITISGWVAKTVLEELITTPKVTYIKFEVSSFELPMVIKSANSIVNNQLDLNNGLLTDSLFKSIVVSVVHSIPSTSDLQEDINSDTDLGTVCIANNGNRIPVVGKSYWILQGMDDIQFTPSSMIPPNAYLVDFEAEQEGAENDLEKIQAWRRALIERYMDDVDSCQRDMAKLDIKVVKGTIAYWLNHQSDQIAPKKKEHFDKITERICGIAEVAERERLWERAERIRTARRIDGRERIALARDYFVEFFITAVDNGTLSDYKTLYHDETLTKITVTKLRGIVNGAEK